MGGRPDWYGQTMRLRNEHGYNLTLQSDGTVLGNKNDDSFSIVNVISSGESSHVRIFGVESKLYLCFKSSGKLYGEVSIFQTVI